MEKQRSRTGIVLGHVDYGEADRILRILTAEEGKISAMARGARRSKKRFAGMLDLGNRVTVQLTRGKGRLPLITEVDLEHGHPHLRADLERISQMAYLCDWTGSLAREEHPEPKLFGLLQVALLVLNAATKPPTRAFRWGFEAKALSFAGIAPGLKRCMVCGCAFEDDELRYSPASGGVVHAHCGSGPALGRQWASQVEKARMTPLAELVDLEPCEGPSWALHSHLAWHVGKGLNSRELLASVEGLG